jgi:hypothetical protein
MNGRATTLFHLAKSCISMSLSGLALRQSIELGFHRNPQRLRARRNSLELETQKRLFSISYTVDRCAAVTLGRPFGISDSDIDLDVSALETFDLICYYWRIRKLPLGVSDNQIAYYGIIVELRSCSTDEPTSMSACIHIVCLWRISSRVHTEYTLSNLRSISRARSRCA